MATLPDTIVSGDENQQIVLVEPDYSASGWTFNDSRILNTTYRAMEWFYLRNGGCGGFRLILKEEFAESAQALTEGWEIHIRIKLTGETDFTTWYRGIIKSVEKRVSGTEVTTDIKGNGYIEQLANIQVQNRYASGMTVEQIVNDIVVNHIRPYTRIVQPSNLDVADDDGISASTYTTQGALHFECNALRALKFLAELQGSREFGVAADRAFYFRAKSSTVQDGLFQENDLIDIVDAGQFFERANKVKVAGKEFGYRDILATAQDVTDITNYGTYEKIAEVPWVEHQNDALRWAENIIAIRKGSYIWKQVTWNEVNLRLERNHPDTALGKIRIYGSDVSNDFDDLDITKIKYMKGYYEPRTLISDIAHPIPLPSQKTTLLRAVVTAGPHQFNFPEEFEDKALSQIDAIKGRMKQFRNPNNVTDLDDVQSLIPGAEIHYSKDVTNNDVVNSASELQDSTYPRGTLLSYLDKQWTKLSTRRTFTTLPARGKFIGEIVALITDLTNSAYGQNYVWNGQTWLVDQSSISGNTQAVATADTTTTSTIDVAINAMSITPIAGTYTVWMSGSFENSNNNQVVYASIYSGGSQIASSEVRCNMSGARGPFPFCCVAKVTVNGSQAIEGKWRVSANTGTMHQRNITIQKVS